ncbi:hypothetical protein BS78_02G268000 [Paspalum vaginatum]|nr:hypothetical protein BS78_02G268000 [Paspalum vaginatum]
MDLKGTQEWTSCETAELKALVAELWNEKSCNRMEALAKRFPAKTIQQLSDKYAEVFVDMLFDETNEEPNNDDATSDLHDWYKLLHGETHVSVWGPSMETPLLQPSRQLVFEAAEGEEVIQKSHNKSSRKSRQAWTAEEHRQFLCGMTCLGRGQWKFISKYFVPSRTPTQLASHAQKHFSRIENNELDDRRQRHSLNDVRLVNNDVNYTANSCIEPVKEKPNGSIMPLPVPAEYLDMESFQWEVSITPSQREQGSVLLNPSRTETMTRSCRNRSLGAATSGRRNKNRRTLPDQTLEDVLQFGQGSDGAANLSIQMVPINQGNLHLNVPPF